MCLPDGAHLHESDATYLILDFDEKKKSDKKDKDKEKDKEGEDDVSNSKTKVPPFHSACRFPCFAADFAAFARCLVSLPSKTKPIVRCAEALFRRACSPCFGSTPLFKVSSTNSYGRISL